MSLCARNLCFTYPASEKAAFSGVSLEIKKGEYAAITGSNGCGKSTFLFCAAGLLTPDSGEIHVEGRVSLVMQDPNDQVVGLTVFDEAAFGLQNQPPSDVLRTVTEALALTGLSGLEERSPASLSGGQLQRLAIAGALARKPDILLLDEPCSMLDNSNRERVLAILDSLHKTGVTIIHVTHDGYCASRAERVVNMGNGEEVGSGKWEMGNGEAARDANANRTTGKSPGSPRDFRENSPLPSLEPLPASHSPLPSFNPLPTPHSQLPIAPPSPLLLSAASFRYTPASAPVFSGFCAEFRAGTVTAVTGESGCGKSTLLRLCAALLLPQNGGVTVFGKNTRDKKTPLSYFRQRAVYSPQTPEAALFENYVADDIAWGPRCLGLKGRALRERVKNAMALAGLPWEEFAGRQTLTLSGGEKRRAALAGVLAIDSPLLLLDEPEAGLDASSCQRLFSLFTSLKSQGKTIIFTTHSEEGAQIADRVVSVESGKREMENVSTGAESTSRFPLRGNIGIHSEVSDASRSRLRKRTELDAFRFFISESVDENSMLAKLDVRVKLALTAALAAVVIALKTPFAPLCVLFGVLALGSLAGRVKIRFLLAGFFTASPWIAIIACLQAVFYTPGDTSAAIFALGPVTVTQNEALRALTLALRLAALMSLVSAFALTTPVRALGGLGAKSSFLPQNLRLALCVALRFFPLLAAEAAHIAEAQVSRSGGKAGRLRLAFGLVIPLLLRSLEKASRLAAAMSVRGN